MPQYLKLGMSDLIPGNGIAQMHRQFSANMSYNIASLVRSSASEDLSKVSLDEAWGR